MLKAGTLLITFLLVGFGARAQNTEVRSFYTGIRALGMGGAGINVVDDETALLTNPAALGKLRDFYGTILDPQLDGSAALSEMYHTQAFSDPFDPAQAQRTLDATRDTYFHAQGMLFPSMVVRNFGIGFFYRNLLDAKTNTTGTQMQTYYLNDLAFVLGYNLRLWDGRIKIGFSGKAIAREEINKSLSTTGDLSVAGNASEGLGLGADVALMLTAPWTWLPSATAVVRDVGGTNFEAGSGLRMSSTTRPNHIDQDIDVAIGLFPIHSNSTRSSFTVEYDKLNEASKATDKMRYAHVGYELNLYDLLFLRAGMNQRYWTAGIELASEYTQVQLASYGADVGPDNAPVEDRRYVFKFSFRF